MYHGSSVSVHCTFLSVSVQYVPFPVGFGTCTISCRFWYMYQGLFLHTYVHALYQVLPDWMTHAALMSDINEGVQELGIFWIRFDLHMHHKKV